MEEYLMITANSKLAVILGMTVALIWFFTGKPIVGHNNGLIDRITHAKSIIFGIIAHTSALYISFVLFVAAFIGTESLVKVITSGFGQTELWLALAACSFEAMVALLKTYIGQAHT